MRRVTELAWPDIENDGTFGWAIESPIDSSPMERMRTLIEAEDPDGTIVPYVLPSGMDNKLLSRIGIADYGLVLMRLPADFDVWSLFHTVDERVPVEALRLGLRTLSRPLRIC